MRKLLNRRLFRLNWPNFAVGYGSAIDMGGGLSLSLNDLYGGARTPQEVDARALASDWISVAQDIRYSLNAFEQKVLTQ